MPNWTSNTVTIRGDKDKLATFKTRVSGENGAFDFNNFKKTPGELADTVSPVNVVATKREADRENAERNKAMGDLAGQTGHIAYITKVEANRRRKVYGSLDWYDWARANWGTKWNACHVELDEGNNYLTYNFDTAWDAPRALVKPITDLAQELGLLIVWDADHESGGYESIVDTEELAE